MKSDYKINTNKRKKDPIKDNINKSLKSKKIVNNLVEYLVEKDLQLPYSKNTISNIQWCWNYKHFRQFHLFDWDKKTSLIDSNFCNNSRICLDCALRQSIENSDKFLHKLQSNNYLNWLFYYTVLTIQHNEWDSPKELFEKVRGILDKINEKIKNYKKGKSKNFWGEYINWYIATIETTDTNNWYNFHLNMLINANKEIPWIRTYKDKHWKEISNSKILSDKYLEITKDSNITSIEKLTFWDNELENKKNIWQVLKYSLKFHSLPTDKHFEFIKTTYWKRLLITFWSLHNLKEKTPYKENQKHFENESMFYIDLIYKLDKNLWKYFMDSKKEIYPIMETIQDTTKRGLLKLKTTYFIDKVFTMKW